jgi:hypothetical protein
VPINRAGLIEGPSGIERGAIEQVFDPLKFAPEGNNQLNTAFKEAEDALTSSAAAAIRGSYDVDLIFRFRIGCEVSKTEL